MVCACFVRIQDSPPDLGDRSVMHTFLLYTGNFLLSSGNFPGFLLLFPVIFRPARIPSGKVFSNLAQPYTKQCGSYPKGFLYHKNAEPEQRRSENSASFLTMLTDFFLGGQGGSYGLNGIPDSFRNCRRSRRIFRSFYPFLNCAPPEPPPKGLPCLRLMSKDS